MHDTTTVPGRALLDECGQLLELARMVARRALEEPGCSSEVGLALEQVTGALGSLQVLCGGLDAPSAPGDRVAGIVQHMLRPLPRAAPSGSPPGARDEHPLRGHSRTIPIPELLSFLQRQGRTGELRVLLPTERISVYFEAGDLVAALSSNSPADSLLGEILVEQGALTREQLDDFIAHPERISGRLGGALTVHQLVTEEQLTRALECQVQRLFHRLLVADDCAFEFREGVRTAAPSELCLNVSQLLFEEARAVS